MLGQTELAEPQFMMLSIKQAALPPFITFHTGLPQAQPISAKDKLLLLQLVVTLAYLLDSRVLLGGRCKPDM